MQYIFIKILIFFETESGQKSRQFCKALMGAKDMATLCLNMIVKNESHIIEKTLENLCQHITFDYWVICDTGSTDNTVEIIKGFFKRKQINGEVVVEAWRNFAYNRNVALQHCAGKADYLFFFDADDEIRGEWQLDKNLKYDAYAMQLVNESGSSRYQRYLIVRNDGNFYWRGVLHEFVEYRQPISSGLIEGDYVVVSQRKGTRNQDQIKKYQQDAQMLEQALLVDDEPDLRPRYTFYLAQSYKDAEERDKAIQWYKVRAGMLEGWEDERYCSYLQLGFLYEEYDYKQAHYYWEQAAEIAPERAEAWYHLARRHSWNKQYAVAYLFAQQAAACAYPLDSRLFLNKAIYDYWGQYELCLTAFKLGKMLESYTAFKNVVRFAPKGVIERVLGQLKSYETCIKQDRFGEVSAILQILKEKELLVDEGIKGVFV